MTANHAEKILEVRGLTKTYGGEAKKGAKQPTPTLDVLKGIDIDIYRGDVVCLIGPSGCGKSTFLRCLNRLEIPTGGSIKFEGIEVDDARTSIAVRQKMGMVFQHFNLFPHLTVLAEPLPGPGAAQAQEPRRRLPSVPRNCWRVSACPIKPMCIPKQPFRRPAAAHCHCPRSGHGPGGHAVRRAHLRP